LRAILLGRASGVRVDRPAFHWACPSGPVPGRGPGGPGRPGASAGRAGTGLPKHRLPGRWCSRQGDGSRAPQGVGGLYTRRRTPVPWTKPLRGDQGEIRRREARVQREVETPAATPLGRPVKSRAFLAGPARRPGRPTSGPDEAEVGVEEVSGPATPAR
jgi:hypothetical protein